MEYTILKLAQLAGVSTRTLRYYDELGILKPARTSSSGYRIYGQAEVDRLQQILFYRELGVSLEYIAKIIFSPNFDGVEALREHREKLLDRRNQLDLLIANVSKTISQKEEGIMMTDREKFEGFKHKLVQDNEEQYGKEARERWGNEAVDRSNARVKGMTREQHDKLNELTTELYSTLHAAAQTGDPAGELAQKAADLHKQWLCFFWDEYTKEAHAGVAQMYVDDPRFTAHYDKEQPGTAAFLRDAILIYTGIKE